MGAQRSYQVGDDIKGPVRTITPQRIEWYDSAMLSAATNELRQVGSNIHTDEEFARSEGFPSVNADGKFIRPVYMDTELHVRGRVRGVESQPNGNVLVDLFVWCEDEHGMKLTDGDAKVEIAGR